MSVSPMKVVSIVGLKEDLNSVIQILGESQSFQPEPVTSFYANTDGFVNYIEQNIYTDLLTEFENSLSTANIKPKIVDIFGFKVSSNQLTDYVKNYTNNLKSFTEKISQIKQDIDSCKKNIEQTSHFVGVKLDMDRVRACQYIKPRFGRIPVENLKRLETDYKDNPYVMFFPTTTQDNYCWGVYMAPIEVEEDVDRIFSGLFFEKYDTSDVNGNPEQYIKLQHEKKLSLEKNLQDAEKELKDFTSTNLEETMKYYTKLNEKAVFQNIKSSVMLHKGNRDSFIICGWIPADNIKSIENQLATIKSVECKVDDAKNHMEKSPPVKLKYNWFSKPYKFYVDMYGVPKYNEIDPTTFVAITYTILFGAMFGDFGHGIVLAIAGIIMYRLKGMKVGKVLVPCGVSSSLFGLLFGSFFGFEETFNGMYKALFGLEEKPIEVMGHSIIHIILASVAIGILLVILAMCLNIYSSFKQGDLASAIFGSNGFAGLILYSTACAGIVLLFMFGINIFNILTILFLIILPLVSIFLAEPLGKLAEGKKNWQPEQWGGYIAQSSFEMIEVILSYLSNTMSFLRVGAFTMVHAGMMIVVFTLIELVGGVSSIGGILVLVFGNLFVIALEGLLVSIQTLRLEFYEMFSRFYSGAGRPFEPVVLERVKSN
ncbi:MAG: V-type ATPase 116kDa subunit family protein [Acutalibacteraceae bacterium]